MNFTVIPKWDGAEDLMPVWIDTYDTNHNRVRPHIKCICGVNTNIDNHHIHADGSVTASYLHQYPDGSGCGWHVFIKMSGWKGGEMLPANGRTDY